jgi:hypothetical protein
VGTRDEVFVRDFDEQQQAQPAHRGASNITPAKLEAFVAVAEAD